MAATLERIETTPIQEKEPQAPTILQRLSAIADIERIIPENQEQQDMLNERLSSLAAAYLPDGTRILVVLSKNGNVSSAQIPTKEIHHRPCVYDERTESIYVYDENGVALTISGMMDKRVTNENRSWYTKQDGYCTAAPRGLKQKQGKSDMARKWKVGFEHTKGQYTCKENGEDTSCTADIFYTRPYDKFTVQNPTYTYQDII